MGFKIYKQVKLEKKSKMTNQELDQSSNDEEEFLWDEYLKKTNSQPVPAECFCQSLVPPVNEFKVGQKLETHDPRNTSSTCIATIIEMVGPRLRLRLDGTDDRNDFWLICDSDLMHPFEHSTKQGRKIQPPLGFGNELSKWPKFLEKLINSAQSGAENLFAPEAIFKPAPAKPPRNEFKIGQKLEAVDPKNPYLICPATVKDIKREKIFISFDGWSQASQFWVSYFSRDLFRRMVQKASYTLQQPGNFEEKHQKRERVQNRSASSSSNNCSIALISNIGTPTSSYLEPSSKTSQLISSIKITNQNSFENSININNSNSKNNVSINKSATIFAKKKLKKKLIKKKFLTNQKKSHRHMHMQTALI